MSGFRRELSPLLPASLRRQLRWTTAGAILLAVLDALGVALVLPLIQLVTSLDAAGDLPAPARWVADLLGTDSREAAALALAGAVMAAFVLKGIAALVLLRFSIRTCLHAESEMARRLIDAYLTAPFEFHLTRNSADLQTTLHESLRHVYQEGLATSIPAVADRLVLIAIGGSLLVIAPVEALVGGVALATIATTYRRLARRRALASSDEVLSKVRSSYQLTQQALTSIREITVTGTGSYFSDELVEVRRAYARRQAVLTLTEQLPRYYLELGLVCGTAAVACVSFSIRPATDALAILGVFMAGGLRLLPSLNRVLSASAKADAAMPHLAQVVDDLARTGAHHPAPTDARPLDAGGPSSTLVLDDLTFRYGADGATVLDRVSLQIEPGEMVALMGESGAGKTTLVSLLLGLLDPTEGAIRIDGTPLQECRRSWQRRLGYVPQDVVVFDAPLADNVAFGDPEPDEARIWAALTAARLDAVVRELPDRLATRVGEAGSRLSGGQRQRLGLARALYRAPSVLILDEATSSLDTQTEQHVLSTLEGLRGKVTMLVVSHRLSTVRPCDRIVVLAGGRVEATGTYEELTRTSSTFQRLRSAADGDG